MTPALARAIAKLEDDVTHIVTRWQPDGLAIARVTLAAVPDMLHREADSLIAGGHLKSGEQVRAVAERLTVLARRLAAEPSAKPSRSFGAAESTRCLAR